MTSANRVFFTIVIASGVSAAPALAEPPPPRLLGTYADWTAYAMPEAKGEICYAVSKPKKLEPAKVKRADAHLLVTHRPAEKQNNVVSVELGYTTAKDTNAAVLIGKDKYEFFTNQQTAWARDSETDKNVVTAMARGNEFVAKAKPPTGSETIDTYSLAGFSDALAQIDKACKVKR